MSLSDFVIPLLFVFVLIFGLAKKVDVFAEFVKGVKEGVQTVTDIFPSLFALMLAVGMFRSSGALDLISSSIAPLGEFFGYPPETLPLILMRPFSGSGAIALYENIISEVGPDSFTGRLASVILGSSETTFYTIAVYFAATKVKKTRHTLPAALSGDLALVVFATMFVR
ncbi:MAG: spore maturation protein [Oscillospiraceae bacterium]|nr:spore maturation protein [Oscillospiraceae bacterium]